MKENGKNTGGSCCFWALFAEDQLFPADVELRAQQDRHHQRGHSLRALHHRQVRRRHQHHRRTRYPQRRTQAAPRGRGKDLILFVGLSYHGSRCMKLLREPHCDSPTTMKKQPFAEQAVVFLSIFAKVIC